MAPRTAAVCITSVLSCNTESCVLIDFRACKGEKKPYLSKNGKNNYVFFEAINYNSVPFERRLSSPNINKSIILSMNREEILNKNTILTCFPSTQAVHKYPRINPPDDPFPNSVNIKNLQDKETIEVEGATLRVHHTPGHTTDHIVVELEEENAIFSGDCILGEGTAVFEDLHSYMSSLKVILDLTPKVMYPGHGPVIEDPIDRIQKYIEHRNLREQQIIQALRDSEAKFLSAMDIVKIVYTTTPEHLHRAAALNVGHHLHKLYKDRLLHQREDKYCLKER
ncbi:unnamed protein product, partial [Meganyctiphanes norvegica]